MEGSKLNVPCWEVCGSINLGNSTLKNDFPSIQFIIDKFESSVNIKEYYFIFHDDTDTLHIQYALSLKKRTRPLTVLNWLSDNLEVNSLAVNIGKCTSLCSYLRYMLHRDKESKELGKKEFDIVNLFTNVNDKSLQLFLESDDKDNLSVEYLISLIVQYPYNSDIMKILGLSAYHKYRYEIKELRDEEYRFKKEYNERNQ